MSVYYVSTMPSRTNLSSPEQLKISQAHYSNVLLSSVPSNVNFESVLSMKANFWNSIIRDALPYFGSVVRPVPIFEPFVFISDYFSAWEDICKNSGESEVVPWVKKTEL